VIVMYRLTTRTGSPEERHKQPARDALPRVIRGSSSPLCCPMPCAYTVCRFGAIVRSAGELRISSPSIGQQPGDRNRPNVVIASRRPMPERERAYQSCPHAKPRGTARRGAQMYSPAPRAFSRKAMIVRSLRSRQSIDRPPQIARRPGFNRRSSLGVHQMSVAGRRRIRSEPLLTKNSPSTRRIPTHRIDDARIAAETQSDYRRRPKA